MKHHSVPWAPSHVDALARVRATMTSTRPGVVTESAAERPGAKGEVPAALGVGQSWLSGGPQKTGHLMDAAAGTGADGVAEAAAGAKDAGTAAGVKDT